jgi:hypothetical protein
MAVYGPVCHQKNIIWTEAYYPIMDFSQGNRSEFTLQQQNVKTKAATKYAVKVLSDFMLE